MLLFLLTAFWIAQLSAHPVREIPAKHRDSVSLFVSQLQELSIPFGKCFKVEAELESNQPYLHFKPSRVEVQPLKSYSLKKEGSNISVL